MLGSKEISEILGVKPTTVRKYAGELEKAGYSVSKSDHGHRQYSEEDATVFRHLKALCDQDGMTVELAAKVVVSRHERAHESVAPAVIQTENNAIERYEERYNEAMELIGKLVEHNQALTDKVERMGQRMDEQHSTIIQVLREVQETRRLVAASSSKKWWEFWKKDLADGPDPEQVWNRKQKPENYL